MNFKNKLNLFFGIVFFVASVPVCASAPRNDSKNVKEVSESNQQGEFFKKFATEANSEAVVFLKKKNRLLLIAFPSLLKDFLAVTGFSLGAAISFAFVYYFPDDKDLVQMALCGAFFTIADLVALYVLAKHYGIRNNPTPHLLFDSVGLKKDNEDKYALKWEDVADVDKVTVINDGVSTIFYRYLSKLGDVLFELSSGDPLLPVEFEKVKGIFNHCLATYGIEKFRVV